MYTLGKLPSSEHKGFVAIVANVDGTIMLWLNGIIVWNIQALGPCDI
jgi:hypothetical protein